MAVTSRDLLRNPPEGAGWKNWGDHPVPVILGSIAAVIAIVIFFSGRENIYQVWRALRPDPVAEQHNQRGDLFYSEGDYKKAETEYNYAIGIDSGRSVYHSNKGFSLLRQGDYDNAIVDFSTAISLDNNNADAYIGRSRAYAGRSDLENAVEDLTAALDIKRNSFYILEERGDVFLKQGEYELAIIDYRKCSQVAAKTNDQKDCVTKELKTTQVWKNANQPLQGVAVPLFGGTDQVTADINTP